METNNILYQKIGRSYLPILVNQISDQLSPGLWLCTIDKCRRSLYNLEWVAKLSAIDDSRKHAVQLGEITEISDKILNDSELQEFIKTDFTIQELIMKIVGKCYYYSNLLNS